MLFRSGEVWRASAYSLCTAYGGSEGRGADSVSAGLYDAFSLTNSDPPFFNLPQTLKRLFAVIRSIQRFHDPPYTFQQLPGRLASGILSGQVVFQPASPGGTARSKSFIAEVGDIGRFDSRKGDQES